MIWNYFRMKKEMQQLVCDSRLLKSQATTYQRMNREARDRIRHLEGELVGATENLSVAGQIQIELQAKLDDLRLSVKGIRKASFRFLELTEDPLAQEDPPPPPPADHLDDLRDMIGVKRDGSQVVRGDPRKGGNRRVQA